MNILLCAADVIKKLNQAQRIELCVLLFFGERLQKNPPKNQPCLDKEQNMFMPLGNENLMFCLTLAVFWKSTRDREAAAFLSRETRNGPVRRPGRFRGCAHTHAQAHPRMSTPPRAPSPKQEAHCDFWY